MPTPEHQTAPPAERGKYPDPITPDVLARHAHIDDDTIAIDIAETEREIADFAATEQAERTIASTHPNADARRLADFRAGARPHQIAERRAFVAFLRRLQAARVVAAVSQATGVLALVLLTGCVLVRPWAPQPKAPPRECVGTFVYPDSAGVCVPREEAR